jgi:hypothetical protein
MGVGTAHGKTRDKLANRIVAGIAEGPGLISSHVFTLIIASWSLFDDGLGSVPRIAVSDR